MDEKQLITAILKGHDSKAFSQLYEHVYPKIKSMILRSGGQEEDAQDIFQDSVMAFFRVVLKKTYKHKTEVDAYIYVVARNAWYARAKSKMKTTTLESGNAFDIETQGLDYEIVNTEKQNLLRQLLASLGERCEALLLNTIYYNMTLTEIVEKMGYDNINTVKTKKYKCKQRLIKVVKKNKNLVNLLRY